VIDTLELLENMTLLGWGRVVVSQAGDVVVDAAVQVRCICVVRSSGGGWGSVFVAEGSKFNTEGIKFIMEILPFLHERTCGVIVVDRRVGGCCGQQVGRLLGRIIT